MIRKNPVSTQDRQHFFPRGMHQPDQGHRFSLDSLLLACYPGFKAGERIIDLGTGCGVVGIGLLLHNPGLGLRVWGLDISRTMIECARRNALNLGLDSHFSALVQDLRSIRRQTRLGPESVEHVLANPPYRTLNQGRLSPVADKNPARFETSSSLEDFIKAGAYLLKNKGRMTLIYLAESVVSLLCGLNRQRLEPKRIRFVHSGNDSRAGLVLVQAMKKGHPGLTVAPPLILYAQSPEGNRLSKEALAFCPFLSSEISPCKLLSFWSP